MPIHQPQPHPQPIVAFPFVFNRDFTATWRITPESKPDIMRIIDTHPEVPFFVKPLIHTLGIPDFRMKVSEDNCLLTLIIGIGPFQKTQKLHLGEFMWEGLFNRYPMHLALRPGEGRFFRVSGDIPSRGYSWFEYRVSDDGMRLSVNGAVPMRPGGTPFALSCDFFMVDRT
jgi:hypothetical protein